MDYILDFHNDLTHWLESEIKKHQHLLKWDGIDISKPIFNFLWYTHLKDRDDYIQYRRGHPDSKFFSETHIDIPKGTPALTNMIHRDLISHPWREILQNEAGKIIIYADSNRRLKYLMPIISDISAPALIITRSYDIPEEILKQSNIKILPLVLLKSKTVVSSGLSVLSTYLTSYIHTLYCYIHWLQPRQIICCDGCQTQYQLAAIFGKKLSTESICYQFGWPGYIHAGFQNLPYTKFFTWADKYSDLMSPYNPGVKFEAKGRLGKVETTGSHDCISFFLQAPIFVSSEQYLSELHDAIISTSKRYPNRTIIVRPHPEAEIERDILQRFEKYRNIEINSKDKIEDIYRRTVISVSQYSSCLVESELFGCNPICYNPTHGYTYDALSSGRQVQSISQLLDLIAKFMRHEI